MQGVGIVAAVGDSVNHIKVGTPVALMTFGSYAEFTQVLHFMHFLTCQITCQFLSFKWDHLQPIKFCIFLCLFTSNDSYLCNFLMKVAAKHLLPVPRPDPEVVAMLTSGLTASIGLEKVYLI